MGRVVTPPWVAGPPHFMCHVGRTTMDVLVAEGSEMRLALSFARRRFLAKTIDVQGADGSQRYSLTRVRWPFYARYDLVGSGGRIWRLSTRSILRHRHVLEFPDGSAWEFRTPFFSLRFVGTESGQAVLLGQIQKVYLAGFWAAPDKGTEPVMIAAALLHEHYANS